MNSVHRWSPFVARALVITAALVATSYTGSAKSPDDQESSRNQVRDRFCLNEIHLAVDERAQGEFARPRESRTSSDRALQYLLQDDGTAVRAELNDVLARVGVRRRKPCGDDLINRSLRSSSALAHARERGVPRQQRCFANQDSRRNLARINPADAYDPQASPAGRGRNRDDGVVGRKHAAR